MKQYVLKCGVDYFSGYARGSAHLGGKSEAVSIPTRKEAENLVLALKKGGFHYPVTVEEVGT